MPQFILKNIKRACAEIELAKDILGFAGTERHHTRHSFALGENFSFDLILLNFRRRFDTAQLQETWPDTCHNKSQALAVAENAPT
jgi:hypothetical protein